MIERLEKERAAIPMPGQLVAGGPLRVRQFRPDNLSDELFVLSDVSARFGLEPSRLEQQLAGVIISMSIIEAFLIAIAANAWLMLLRERYLVRFAAESLFQCFTA